MGAMGKSGSETNSSVRAFLCSDDSSLESLLCRFSPFRQMEILLPRSSRDDEDTRLADEISMLFEANTQRTTAAPAAKTKPAADEKLFRAKTYILVEWNISDLINPNFLNRHIRKGLFCCVSTTTSHPQLANNTVQVTKGVMTLQVDHNTYTQLGLRGRKVKSTTANSLQQQYKIQINMQASSFQPGDKLWERCNWCFKNRTENMNFIATWDPLETKEDSTIIPPTPNLTVAPWLKNTTSDCSYSHTTLPVILKPKPSQIVSTMLQQRTNDDEDNSTELASGLESLLVWSGLVAGRLLSLLQHDALSLEGISVLNDIDNDRFMVVDSSSDDNDGDDTKNRNDELDIPKKRGKSLRSKKRFGSEGVFQRFDLPAPNESQTFDAWRLQGVFATDHAQELIGAAQRKWLTHSLRGDFMCLMVWSWQHECHAVIFVFPNNPKQLIIHTC
eukprot:c2148_g1_i1.p1 GENE.c2148_g1_i1~~c2148_g1_i1.p1  ORF type:complete len:445 (-),score=92.97 c2148_g1_i1:209-1543(-)